MCPDRNAVKEFFQSYHKSHKNLDIYINNAAYSIQATLEETSQEDIDGLLDTNLKGALCCLQQSGQIMKEQRSGSIIVITSVNGLNPHPTQAMYSVTKFALEGAVKALASSLGPYNVRVNSCAPGAIDTPINTEAFNKPGFKEIFSKKVALRRIGTIEEIGEAVAPPCRGCFSLHEWSYCCHRRGLDVEADSMMLATIIKEATPQAGEVFFWWLGQSGFVLKSDSLCIVLDPYLSTTLEDATKDQSEKRHIRMMDIPLLPNELTPIDYVVISHGHRDHYDPTTIKSIVSANPACTILAPKALSKRIETEQHCRVLGLDDGQHWEENGLLIGTNPCKTQQL